MQPQVKQHEYGELSLWRVLAVSALLVYIAAWLVVALTTRDIWVNNLLRPYVPDWGLLVVAVSTPITAAVVALRNIP